MRTLIIGANGSTGFKVVQQLKAGGKHEPIAMIRSDEQQPRFAGAGVETVKGDLLHPIDDVVEGCDAVVFAAGSGAKTGKDMTVLIDQLGAIRTAVAALNAGAKRFVLLSGLNTDRDAKDDPIPHWRRAKGRADDFLRTMHETLDGEGLEYTIVCPGALHDDDEEPTGVELVSPDGKGLSKPRTSRANTAAVMVTCLDEDAAIRQTIGVVDGEAEARNAIKAWKA
ncbi:MAG: SDR family oxidoreductase [Phycisphaerales bacterium]|jgi:nucleoside-diphosphate-sugar epimerase